MRLIALIAAAALLAGCQSPCPAVGNAPVAVSYNCDDNASINVTYYSNPRRAHLQEEGFPDIDLQHRPGGGAFRYAKDGVNLEGRIGRVTLSRPGAADTMCSERPHPVGAPASPIAQQDVAIRACRQ
jgi:hypothetical protein